MKITLQITRKYRLSMASPYLTRTRNCPPTPETKAHLFKVFQLSPKTSGRETTYCSRNKQINSSRSISKTNSVSCLGTGRVDNKPLILSQQELIINDHSNSSVISSEAIREKKAQSQLLFQKAENNGSSLGLEQTNLFAAPESEKIHRKNSQGSHHHEKRQKRSQHLNHCLGVPYRKCHSSMEEKIVSIINKIKNQKECHKEIETLLERAKKVSVKELSNRYFISGIIVILRLVEQWKTTYGLVHKIESVISELKERISQELDCIKGFDITIIPQPLPQFDKTLLIRKAYQALRKKKSEKKKQALQDEAIKTTRWFLEQQPRSLHLFWDELRKF